MSYDLQNPIIVQGDRSVLLEVDNPHYQAARDILARFAELEKSPEYIHTYRISPLSLWNAAASGLDAEGILAGLEQYSKYPIPDHINIEIKAFIARYGRVKMVREGDELHLTSEDKVLIKELINHKKVQPYIVAQLSDQTLSVNPALRGHVKQVLVNIGYPAEDLAGYVEGESLAIDLPSVTKSGEPFVLRNYQQNAAEIFYAGGAARGGSGVIVLPCGAGKTIVGLVAMQLMQCNTLILTPNTVSVHQWITELLDKTELEADQIGEYTGQRKQVRPVTVATYQTVTYRNRRKENGQMVGDEYSHFALFNQRDWGLIIYDEVHLLPAPVFRVTAELQARRRLGLTATLVREDGREEDVFSLIGPKKYDVPWKDLERQGWIAKAEVIEVRVPMIDDIRLEYAVANKRQKYRVAAENPLKYSVIDELLTKHNKEQILIIGMYVEQLQTVEKRYGFPIITGKTSIKARRDLYQKFKDGELRCLIVSKVGNFAIDLPNASVMIQISGTFGSRQEEAQRLGRILRPKEDGQMAHFYTVVTKDTQDQEFSANRQLFLTEQGYRYTILYGDEVAAFEPGETDRDLNKI